LLQALKQAASQAVKAIEDAKGFADLCDVHSCRFVVNPPRICRKDPPVWLSVVKPLARCLWPSAKVGAYFRDGLAIKP
jgi:hypothetical protein